LSERIAIPRHYSSAYEAPFEDVATRSPQWLLTPSVSGRSVRSGTSVEREGISVTFLDAFDDAAETLTPG
jgi:hypothetical protein